jgi:hypothetical protein
MTQEFVPYEQALALKELGFDEPCFGYYSEGELILNSHTNNHMQRFRYSAPTFSQAFRWFREKHNLKDKYGVFPHHTIMFNYIIGGGKEEEAELACLRKLIEIVKNK